MGHGSGVMGQGSGEQSTEVSLARARTTGSGPFVSFLQIVERVFNEKMVDIFISTVEIANCVVCLQSLYFEIHCGVVLDKF